MKLFVCRVGHSWDSNVSEYDNIFQSLNTIYNNVISYNVNTIEGMFLLCTKIQMIRISPITVITVSLIKIDA